MTRRITAALALAALVMAGVNLKIRLSTGSPRFDPEDETGYFRAESALQYRYARMAAAGRPLPEVDRDAQWPEGLRPRRELTSVMERLTGLSYRWLAPTGTDFRWFVILWVAVVSSLSIAAFYGCAVFLIGPAPALAACAAYGLSWAAQSNEIASYRLETLALPLIFASLACSAALLDPKTRRPHAWGAASAALLLAAFASWHFTRFYLATYLLAAGLSYWRRRDRRMILATAYAAAAGLLALIVIPSARASSYGHVYGLLFAKLAHGLRHPADPALLSPIQRLEWTGPSNSPDPGFALFALLPLGLIAAPRAWAKLRGEDPEPTSFGMLADGLFWIYLAGAALVSRLMPCLAFFLGLFALRLPGRLATASWLPPALAVLALLEAFKCLAPASPLNPFMRLSAPFASEELRPTVSLGAERQLLAWLRRFGGPERPTLAPMGLSAEILAYGNTPVLLQPKWEAAGVRAKTAEYARALFETEEAFAAACARYGAKLVVHGADTLLDETPEGLRYASGRMSLREDSAAFLLHFHPDRLKRFRLVFQNEGYRVYAAEPPKPGETAPSLPVYDLSQYAPRPRGDGTVALDVPGVLRRMQLSRMKTMLARILSQLGRGEEALSSYDEAFSAWPPEPALRQEYDTLRRRLEEKR